MSQMTMLPPKTERSQKFIKQVGSDDRVLIKQITATHAPDGPEIDVKPILQIVEDILKSATATTPDHVKATEALPEEQSNLSEVFAMFGDLSSIINQISYQISYKCMDGGDAHSTSISLLNLLSSYSWEAKLVLTLAAFALNYGDFLLLVQMYPTNKLAGRMAILKQLSFVLEKEGVSKPRFEALNSLVKSILVLTRCIAEFTELPSKYISQDNSAYSTAVAAFPTAIYWIFRSVIVCSTNIAYLSGVEHDISTSESRELSALTLKINTMNENLQKQLTICQQYIEEKMQTEIYEALLRVFETSHIDNMKVLRMLICPRDDQQPLVDGTTKKRVNLDVLRRKTVLLLISSLDISLEEVAVLEEMYMHSKQHSSRPGSDYEVVWLPVTVTPWTESNQKKFEMLQSSMPWYSAHHPNLTDVAVTRFFKENLHFNRKPMLVVLDPQGKIVCPNALHMMWIWGTHAFPFTSRREETLWTEETWRLQLLVDGIDPTILDWIEEGKRIVLYGSDDIEWIRQFTHTARAVASTAHLPLEMVYVGKGSTFKREQIQRAVRVVTDEHLSHAWPDLTSMWFFWTRLESMLSSKIELRSDHDEDPILQEIKKVLSYEKTGPWVLFSEGSKVILNGFGTTALSAFQQYDMWQKDAETRGFESAFKDHYEMLLQADHPCCRLEFETIDGKTPESMKCPECKRSMEKFLTFSCCHN